MSKNLELVEVVLKSHGFSFYVVDLPDELLEEKLAFASSDTGLLSRIEYQDFLFQELIVNIERVFRFIAEDTGGDFDAQISLRNKVEEQLYFVNPRLRPEAVVVTGGGLLKPAGASEGTPLNQNPDWDKIPEDINPYVFIEEYDLIPVPPEEDARTTIVDDHFIPHKETVELVWDRLGLVLKIKRFNKEDIQDIVGPEYSFADNFHYKMHVIHRCVDKAESVLLLCDAVGLTSDESIISDLVDELYDICIKVNPFLKLEEVNLEDIRSKRRTPTRNQRSRSNKTKRGSGKKFSDITKGELLTLEQRLNSKVIGQAEAIEKIVDNIQIASCGLRDPESPIAVYLMCGTTGVGKTLTAKVLAEELCGSKDNIIRVDCSEYTQQHDVQKLLGAPPSYVGYEDGGYLTNAIQENPFSVVLFDEIEKAHNKLFDLLLQIMDDARLTDGKGNVTDFKDCIILMTSNVGVSEAEAVKSTMGFGDAALLTDERKDDSLKQALKNKFRPEFLNRIDEVLNFRSLTKEDALRVVDLLLEKVKGYLREKNITVDFTPRIREMVFDKGFSHKYGARPLERAVNKEIIRGLAKMILKEEVKNNTFIRVDYVKNKLVVRELNYNKKATTVQG